MTLLPLLATLPALLGQFDLTCWNRFVDKDGSFACYEVMPMGKLESDPNRWFYPDLAAPDSGGPVTQDQAWQACRRLGFRGAVSFTLGNRSEETLMATMKGEGATAYAETGKGAYIRHVNCAN